MLKHPLEAFQCQNHRYSLESICGSAEKTRQFSHYFRVLLQEVFDLSKLNARSANYATKLKYVY